MRQLLSDSGRACSNKGTNVQTIIHSSQREPQRLRNHAYPTAFYLTVEPLAAAQRVDSYIDIDGRGLETVRDKQETQFLKYYVIFAEMPERRCKMQHITTKSPEEVSQVQTRVHRVQHKKRARGSRI
jgi:hypothetical protein